MKISHFLTRVIPGFIVVAIVQRAAPVSAQSALDGFDPNVTGLVYALAVQADGKVVVGGNFTAVGGMTRRGIARLNVDGSVDATFNSSASNAVNCLALQPDGKILVGGSFATLGGQPRSNIGRLNSNGSLDASFDAGTIGGAGVKTLALQADGKILLGGDFTMVAGQPRNRIARLNPNGTLDVSFDPGADDLVTKLLVQGDGKILAAGDFTVLAGGTQRGIGRLNVEGGLDGSGVSGSDGSVSDMALQADGKILVGGSFTSLGGVNRARIGRLNRDGTVDAGFDPGANGNINSLLVQTDGKIVVGGSFLELGGTNRTRLGRLRPDGRVDTEFADSAPDALILSLAIQSDGKILAAGGFTRLGGTIRNHVGRLYPDGSLDRTINQAVDDDIYALAVQPDGRILVGGQFGSIASQARERIGRLYPDGRLDGNFNPGADSFVLSFIVQPDGKILVGGYFTHLGGQPRNRIGRLNPDGSLEPGFNPNADGLVYCLALQSDGKILSGGNFTMVGTRPRNRIARINADGSPDLAFNPGADNWVSVLAVQADGKILLCGAFSELGGQPRSRIGRLNPDGSVDAAFNPGANSLVECLAVQADGKILLGGRFTSVGGQARSRLARLNPDGTVDASFNPGANDVVSALTIQADGKIVAGGAFTLLGGQTRANLGRLNADGSLDTAFTPLAESQVYTVAVQYDGKILSGGVFFSLAQSRLHRFTSGSAALQSLALDSAGTAATWLRSGAGPEIDQVTFEQSTDGSTFANSRPGTRIAGGWQLTGLSLPAGRNFHLRARGRTTGGYASASSGLVEAARQFYLPDITPPTITCPPATNVQCVEAVPAPDFAGGHASDAVDSGPMVTWAGDVTNGLCPTVVTRTYRATDASGNANICTQLITVQDTTAPTLDGQGANQTLNCPAMPLFVAPTASDNCDPSPTITVTDVTTPGPAAGSYSLTRTWVATDRCGNHSAPVSQVITIVDTTAPVIACSSNLVVECTGPAGAEASFATSAIDACDPNPVVICTPASGSTFAIGTNTVTCTATDAHTNQSSCSFQVTVLGARGIKLDCLTNLMTLRAGVTNRHDGEELDDAIEHLTKSLDSNLWIDQTHLQRRGGDKVFEEAKKAVHEPAELLKDRSSTFADAALRALIECILRADRMLAVVSVDEAEAAGVKPRKLAEDRREIDKGDEDSAEGKYEEGIEHYSKAWKHAIHIKIDPPHPLAGGGARLTFLGLEGENYVIQASSDLIHWITLGVANTNADGEVSLDDPEASQFGARYYRILPP